MRRLIWGFAGRTYHIVGNLMHWLKFVYGVNSLVLVLIMTIFFWLPGYTWSLKSYYTSIKDTSFCGHLDFNCLKLKYEVNHDILLFILAPGYSVFLGGQCLSGRVLDSRLRGSRFVPHRCQCIVVLEQDTFILALHWFNLGRPVPV